MAASFPGPCSGREPEVSCVCRAAVTRAYYEMRGRGMSQAAAMEVAVRVYNYHHPGLPAWQVAQIIEPWVVPTALH